MLTYLAWRDYTEICPKTRLLAERKVLSAARSLARCVARTQNWKRRSGDVRRNAPMRISASASASAAARGLLLLPLSLPPPLGSSMGAAPYFSTRIHHVPFRNKKRFISSSTTTTSSCSSQINEPLLVVVGGGAAGIYASIRAKTLAPQLNVLVIEKGKPLSKVKISGGGRCNVTNGHFLEAMRLTENYPRGNKELRGSFFNVHGPQDTMGWFSDHGVQLKTEDDGRVFPVSNSSASIVDCLLNEAKRVGVSLQTGKVVSSTSVVGNGKFLLTVEKRTIDFVEHLEATYVLVATGSSKQLITGLLDRCQLGHSIIDPMPSLFTFKIEDAQLASLSGVTFQRVKARLKLDNVGPMLVTHWGLSGPVILRLSAWGARELFRANYTGMLLVDFVPGIHIEEVKSILFHHKDQFAKHKASNSFPLELVW
uniref:FAD/NAD(P)-binding oxidoreductase family protein n=1 Tax=Ananas comosus var. bracteatus TaxID=296719 RepID=A0A6V7QF98_ANACO|nr:unnamed protein product [Ananas comosus var. bracteatus]